MAGVFHDQLRPIRKIVPAILLMILYALLDELGIPACGHPYGVGVFARTMYHMLSGRVLCPR